MKRIPKSKIFYHENSIAYNHNEVNPLESADDKTRRLLVRKAAGMSPCLPRVDFRKTDMTGILPAPVQKGGKSLVTVKRPNIFNKTTSIHEHFLVDQNLNDSHFRGGRNRKMRY